MRTISFYDDIFFEMKIIYCIDSIVSSGGTERVLTTKVNWLAKQHDIQVIIVSLREAGDPYFNLDDNVCRAILDVRNGDKRSYQQELSSIVEKEKPDIMVAVAGMSVDALPRLKDNSKKVLEFHYTRNFLVNFVRGIHHIRFRSLHLLKMYYLQWKLARQARKFDRFVGLTRRDIGLWGKPSNMTYIHNPLSFRSEIKSDCKSKKIISVGSWTPVKGMDQLLEAFGPLASSYPDWTVELYGSGQDEALLRSIIRRYGMEHQVLMNAPVKNIGAKLAEASIYAFPSRSDGFGLVITEAMECGLPTVAMDCPCGPCEIVTPQTGIVVPDKDIVAFREALKKLMDDESLRQRMGKAAQAEVTRFYPDTIMPKWLKLLQDLDCNRS